MILRLVRVQRIRYGIVLYYCFESRGQSRWISLDTHFPDLSVMSPKRTCKPFLYSYYKKADKIPGMCIYGMFIIIVNTG